MKATLTKIGNSKGLIIPSKVLRQCGFDDDVEIEVRGNSLILSPASHVREGWEEAFKKNAVKEAAALPEYASAEWDKEEWQW